MFDYIEFANKMSEQSLEQVPVEFTEEEKTFVSTTIKDFVKLAGEALNKEYSDEFSDEQKIFILQLLADWTLHKSVDLKKDEILCEHWSKILQKIAFTIFEIAKQALLHNIPQEQVLEAVEKHVKKVYEKCINKNRQLSIIVRVLIYLFVGLILLAPIFIIIYVLKTYMGFSLLHIIIGLVITAVLIIKMLAFMFKVVNKDVEAQLTELESTKQKLEDLISPDRMYERLGVDVISMQVGQDLLCIADSEQDGELLPKIAAMRRRLTDYFGYIIPKIRISDSFALDKNEYIIFVRQSAVGAGFVYPDKYMVTAEEFDKTGLELPQDTIKSEEPAYKTNVYWINEKFVKQNKNITAVAPDDVIIQHLQKIVIQQVDYILSETEIIKYIETVKKVHSGLIEYLTDKLSYGDIRQVLVNLIQEKVSIKDIAFILSKLDDYSRFHKEPDILSERLRKDLSRQISLYNSNADRIIYGIELSQELSKKLLSGVELQNGFNKTKLVLDKQTEHDLIESIAVKLAVHKIIDVQPVIICDDKLRLALYRLLVKHIPSIVVIANNEIEQDITLKTVDTIQ